MNNLKYFFAFIFTFSNIFQSCDVIEGPFTEEIIVEATFDNTTNNPDNPFSPPKEISERKDFNGRGSMKTSDEMLQFIVNYLEYQEGNENIVLSPQ